MAIFVRSSASTERAWMSAGWSLSVESASAPGACAKSKEKREKKAVARNSATPCAFRFPLSSFLCILFVETDPHPVKAHDAAGSARAALARHAHAAGEHDDVVIFRHPAVFRARTYRRTVLAVLGEVGLLDVGAFVVAIVDQARAGERVLALAVLIHRRGMEILDGVVGVVAQVAVERRLGRGQAARQPPGSTGQHE